MEGKPNEYRRCVALQSMRYKLPPRLVLALRNVFRQRARTVTTLAAIGMGVAALILAGGFVEDIFVQLGEAIIHSQSGHIQITRTGYREGRLRNAENYLIDQPDKLKAEISASPQVEMVMARLSFAAVLNNGRRDLGVIGEGIEAGPEAQLGSYLHFVEGRALTDHDIAAIVVGQGVAKSLGLKVGDQVTVVISLPKGAVNTLDFELVGIFQSFSREFDARAVRIPIGSARDLMDTQSAHTLVVALARTQETERVLESLRARLAGSQYAVTSWRELSDFYEKTLQLYDRQFGVLRLIILLMVLLSVANSINMSLFERGREFGTMQALGNRPASVFRLIVTEAVVLGTFGAGLGMFVGCSAAWVISAIGIPMPPPPNANLSYTATIRLVPADVALAGAIGWMATVLAALLPARRAARMNVVEALRQGT
jgi:putative ABC transport system permease protein